MNSIDLVRDGLGRSFEGINSVLDGLDADQLSQQPAPGANPVGWLAWHMSRVEDSHLADLAATLGIDGFDELIGQGWSERLGLPYAPDANGYAMTADDVARFRVADPQVLRDYAAAVHEQSLAILDRLEAMGPDEALDRVVDENWTPHVVAGVRLVSVVDDLAQHHGQAAYVRGLIGA